jgi:hypothetical protein
MVASGGRRLLTEEEAARKGEKGTARARWGEVDPKVGNGIERLGERWDGLLFATLCEPPVYMSVHSLMPCRCKSIDGQALATPIEQSAQSKGVGLSTATPRSSRGAQNQGA